VNTNVTVPVGTTIGSDIRVVIEVGIIRKLHKDADGWQADVAHGFAPALAPGTFCPAADLVAARPEATARRSSSAATTAPSM
jgi:hypothetical protein